MKRPLYVLDSKRHTVYGQFFKRKSAADVATLIQRTTGNRRVTIITHDSPEYRRMLRKLGKGTLHIGTEVQLYCLETLYRLDSGTLH